MGFKSLILHCILSLISSSLVLAQQPYVGLGIYKCHSKNSSTSIFGYTCNGQKPSCQSYLIFRSDPPYNTVSSIADHLASDPAQLASINSVPEAAIFQTDKEVIVPVDCSCSGKYYQVNASYIFKERDTRFVVANDIYQGLTTCQAVWTQTRNTTVIPFGTKITIPLRCACPTKNQTKAGVKYLLSYLIAKGDSVARLSRRFGVEKQRILDANQISINSTIYPSTTLLIPLTNRPSSSLTITPPLPSPSSSSPPSPDKGFQKRWVYLIIGVAICSILLVASIVLFSLYCARNRKQNPSTAADEPQRQPARSPEKLISGLSDISHGLKVYEFEELQMATENFSTRCGTEGSVYFGFINGDAVAIKEMETDIVKEINILKTVHHFNLIRLFGVSTNGCHWYLVYEYAENGPLSVWLHDEVGSTLLNWVMRIQIALDVANGLNYIHSYTDPVHVHMDISASNILLDGDFRAKIAKFGMARPMELREGGFALTSHIVGTKGYLSPEYLEQGLVSQKLDVYAFGVVLLELVTGKDAVIPCEEGDRFLSDAFLAFSSEEHTEKKLEDFMDPSLHGNYPLDLALMVAQLIEGCLRKDAVTRLSMEDVVQH